MSPFVIKKNMYLMKLSDEWNVAKRNEMKNEIEVQNTNEGYIYRGRIKTIEIKDNTLTVHHEWLAKNNGTPSLPGIDWTLCTYKLYEASLEIYNVSDAGNNRIMLDSIIVGETVVLFPRGDGRLDLSKVYDPNK